MDMHTIKGEVDVVIKGLRASNTDEKFIEAVMPVLPALVRGQPNAYMSAVYLVGLAEEIVLGLYGEDSFLDFGNFLERSAASVKRCALSSKLSQGDGGAND